MERINVWSMGKELLMKIIWVLEKYLDIALDKSARIETIKSLKKRNVKVILLTGYKNKKEYYNLPDNIRYLFSIKTKGLHFLTLNLSIFFYSFILLRKWQPDVVLCGPFSVFPLVPVNIVSKFICRKVKFVMDIRSIPVEVNSLSDKLKEYLFNLSIVLAKNLFDGITVISPFMRRYVTEKYHLDEKMIGVWSSGASLEHFNPSQLSKKKLVNLKEKLNLDKKFVVMYHGVLTPNRGLQETIKAINLLKDSFKDIVFLIVGNGSAKLKLQKLIANYQIDENIKLIDSVPYDEIPYYIELCDIGILPFPHLIWWRVSSPIKLMEYMAMRKPVILSKIEAHTSIPNIEKAVFFIDSNSPEQITTQIEKAYINRGRLKSIGKEGYKIVSENYAWDIQANKLLGFLKNV